jgi:electron transfer flavoprotein beta subunit
VSVRIVVCAKEVLDPDAVNNYALEGRLTIGDDGRTLTQTSIPRVMNAYDEQGIEAALRLRERASPARSPSCRWASRTAARF